MIIRAVFMAWSIIILTSHEPVMKVGEQVWKVLVIRVNVQVLENAESEYLPSINESLPFQTIFNQLNMCNLNIM